MYDAACVFVCVGGLEEGFECVWDACVCVSVSVRVRVCVVCASALFTIKIKLQ